MEEVRWFSGRLRELRERAGLTQQQLAEKAGLSQRAVSHWEQGLREPSWGNVIALTKALDVDANAFLQPPQAVAEVKPGRPRKATGEEAEKQEKRPVGRPRKAPTATRDTAEKGRATSAPSRQEKPATGQGRKGKSKG